MTEEPGWEQFKRGVRRLSRAPAKTSVKHPLEPLATPPSPIAMASSSVSAAASAVQTMKKAAIPAPPRLSRTAIDDPELLRRIMQGKTAIEATLDLHHHSEATAHQAVLAFLAQAKQRRWRILRIITGRGAVLRPVLPRWLAASPANPSIRWIAPAAPRHGGDGAVYIVLRGKPNHKK